MRRPEPDPFVTYMSEDDMDDCGEHEEKIYPLVDDDAWKRCLQASGLTEEQYLRQCDEIVQMQLDYQRDLQIYRETGEWPL